MDSANGLVPLSIRRASKAQSAYVLVAKLDGSGTTKDTIGLDRSEGDGGKSDAVELAIMQRARYYTKK